MLGCLHLGFVIEKFGASLEKDIISHLSRLQYTLGSCICDSVIKIHDIHLYLRYKNSYVLFSDRRTVVRPHAVQTQFFYKLVCIYKKGPRGFTKMTVVGRDGVIEISKMVG